MLWIIDSFDLYTLSASCSFRRNFKFRIVHEKFIILSSFVDPEQPVTVPDVHTWSVHWLEGDCWQPVFKWGDNFEGWISIELRIILDHLIKVHFMISVSEHFIGLICVRELIARALLQEPSDQLFLLNERRNWGVENLTRDIASDAPAWFWSRRAIIFRLFDLFVI